MVWQKGLVVLSELADEVRECDALSERRDRERVREAVRDAWATNGGPYDQIFRTSLSSWSCLALTHGA